METIMPNTLSPAEITALLAGSRNRGGHEAYMKRFASSGNMAWIVNDAPEYAGKTEEQLTTSVKQGLNNALRKIENPENYKVIWDADNKRLIVVNRSAVAAVETAEVAPVQ